MKNYETLNLNQKVSERDPFTSDRYKQFYAHFPKQATKVLDVGCNTGRGGSVLKQLNPQLQITGLDCVKSRLERIPQEVYHSKICSYSTQIQAEDSSFDVIVAGEFIEHLYLEDVNLTLQEFYRVLKSGGRVLLTTPNPNYLKLKLTGRKVTDCPAHVSQHDATELTRRLAEIGFIHVKTIGSGKVYRILGEHFPFTTVYGSYLAQADKA